MNRYLLTFQTILIILILSVSFASAEGVTDFNAHGEPVTISADTLSFDPEKKLYIAEGNVEIIQGKRVLSADRATLDKDTGDARASGKVLLMEEGDSISCETMDININNRKGVIGKGRIFIKKGNFHVSGEEIQKTGDEDYIIKRGKFTTCDGDSPAWNFSATTADVTIGEYLTAWNATYRIKGVPVLYVPYLVMPVKRERQSGFLIPRINYSTIKGTEIDNSFFWAISKNTDATISLNYMSEKGVEEGLEYRYVLSKDTSGAINGTYLKEQDTDIERWTVKYRHEQFFSPSFFNKTNINYISDTEYYRTYGEEVEVRSLDKLESYVSFTKNWQNYSLVTQFKYYKELTGLQETSLQRLPEILFTGLRQQMGKSPVYLTINSSAVNFYRDEGEKGQRLDLNPRLSTTISPRGYFTFTPELGLRETSYYSDGNGSWNSREMYDVRASLLTTFLRVFSLNGEALRKVRHSIEPEVVYEYIPEINQDNLPSFDPVDRIGKRNVVTYSLTNRLAGKIYSSESDYHIREFVFFKVSQGYDINEANREVASATDERRPLTDYSGQLRITPNDYITLISDASLGTYDGYLKVLNSSAVINDGRGDSLAVDYRYTRDSLEYIRGKVSVRASATLDVSYDSRYSLLEDKYLENIYAIDYHPQCWSIQFSYSERPEERRYLAVFNLTGIGTVGRIRGGTSY